MKLIFIKERELDNPYDLMSLRMESEVVTLSEALEAFEGFLRGAGFVLDGSVTIEPKVPQHPKDAREERND